MLPLKSSSRCSIDSVLVLGMGLGTRLLLYSEAFSTSTVTGFYASIMGTNSTAQYNFQASDRSVVALRATYMYINCIAQG
jgi:hypothetical protein